MRRWSPLFGSCPNSAQTLETLRRAKVSPESIISPDLVRLPEGVDGSQIVLIDQVVSRLALGNGVGTLDWAVTCAV